MLVNIVKNSFEKLNLGGLYWWELSLMSWSLPQLYLSEAFTAVENELIFHLKILILMWFHESLSPKSFWTPKGISISLFQRIVSRQDSTYSIETTHSVETLSKGEKGLKHYTFKILSTFLQIFIFCSLQQLKSHAKNNTMTSLNKNYSPTMRKTGSLCGHLLCIRHSKVAYLNMNMVKEKVKNKCNECKIEHRRNVNEGQMVQLDIQSTAPYKEAASKLSHRLKSSQCCRKRVYQSHQDQ